jgi:hypothetical protein
VNATGGHQEGGYDRKDTAVKWHNVVIINIIILISTFIQDVYNYIPETNHVYTVYSVTAVLYLQSVLHVMLFRP